MYENLPVSTVSVLLLSFPFCLHVVTPPTFPEKIRIVSGRVEGLLFCVSFVAVIVFVVAFYAIIAIVVIQEGAS